MGAVALNGASGDVADPKRHTQVGETLSKVAASPDDTASALRRLHVRARRPSGRGVWEISVLADAVAVEARPEARPAAIARSVAGAVLKEDRLGDLPEEPGTTHVRRGEHPAHRTREARAHRLARRTSTERPPESRACLLARQGEVVTL